MTKLYLHFKNDFKGLEIGRKLNTGVDAADSSKSEKIEIEEKVIDQYAGSQRFFTYYIPKSNFPALYCKQIIETFEENKKICDSLISITSFKTDISIGKHTIAYSNRIYIYTENGISKYDLDVLSKFAESRGIYLTIRSQQYVNKKMETTTYLAFISHDSRDKKLIARPIAEGLRDRLCHVWYDEYSLDIGDSLRESIEKGIKEAKKCVVILTKNFLSNPGWSKKEFNSIFTREMIFNEKVVLPIWYGVSKEDVYNYSPSLVDIFALIWPNPDEYSEEDYKSEVQLIISKIHAAVNS